MKIDTFYVEVNLVVEKSWGLKNIIKLTKNLCLPRIALAM
jgi:hypothetical protein